MFSSSMGDRLHRAGSFLNRHLNFFRYHLLFFTFTPIVISALLYAGNGSSQGNANTGVGIAKLQYIDCLFMAFSAMTVTGLVTVNVSALRPFQQFLLFILFIAGDFSVVSLIMVLVRKRFFRKHCETIVRASKALPINRTETIFSKAFTISTKGTPGQSPRQYHGARISGPRDARAIGHFVDDNADLADSPVAVSHMEDVQEEYLRSRADQSGSTTAQSSAIVGGGRGWQTPSPGVQGPSTQESHDAQAQYRNDFGRTLTINVPTTSAPRRGIDARQQLRARSRGLSMFANTGTADSAHGGSARGDAMPHYVQLDRQVLPNKGSTTPASRENDLIPSPGNPKHSGLGGFPTPLQFFHHLIPSTTHDTIRQRIAKPERKMTLLTSMPTMPSDDKEAQVEVQGVVGDADSANWTDDIKASMARWMPARMSGLVIGRNSRFYTEELDDDQLEEVGGVEYRALRLLSYLVPTYIFLFQIVPFAMIAIYMSKVDRWDPAFIQTPGVQAGTVDKTWWALFLSVSAYTGSGMSLVDQNMYPFSSAYLVVFALVVVLLAGNHALPMMLRLIIWIGTKIWRQGKVHETLHFLLDHPRRCFLYLFPSHQTWYLLFILIAFVAVEMFGFLVLNIGLNVLESLSGWQKFADALFQSLSVRASGFGIVPIANMAPAVLFLYIILMYVAIYPIAMSVRSTNVYEEQALGVYEPEDPSSGGESEPAFQGDRTEVFSKYLGWHVKKQLAFDIWPLTFAIFLICISERGKILDEEKGFFTVFRVIFEATSGYSTIGLTMGTPNNNYSFCAEYNTVSKLIMILVMLRGRHRGLPVAIDRAILLPRVYARIDQNKQEDEVNGDGQPGHGSAESSGLRAEPQQSAEKKIV